MAFSLARRTTCTVEVLELMVWWRERLCRNAFSYACLLTGECTEGEDSELAGDDGGVLVTWILESCISRKIPDNFGGHKCWGPMVKSLSFPVSCRCLIDVLTLFVSHFLSWPTTPGPPTSSSEQLFYVFHQC